MSLYFSTFRVFKLIEKAEILKPGKRALVIFKMEESLPSRWEIELEFVQSLANIQYLNYLAQNNYLNDERFLNYLKYLEYWKNPNYAKYLVYPNCLHILTLLQSEEFRKSIINPDFMNTLMNDMVKRWQDPESGADASPSIKAETKASLVPDSTSPAQISLLENAVAGDSTVKK